MSNASEAGRKPSGASGRPSLFGKVAPVRPSAAPTSAPPADAADAQAGKGGAGGRSAVRGRRDREDKRQIAGFFSAECSKQLRMLAAEEDTTVQELLREGLNVMFQQHGKPPIA